uniref:surfeit locus protein 2-like isoform X1 n=2 Tax=Styela clava TaxID=7725 RepID=UPI001939AA1C|nr:surfeit locus protein 2-like isoform X1 [Styela clava]
MRIRTIFSYNSLSMLQRIILRIIFITIPSTAHSTLKMAEGDPGKIKHTIESLLSENPNLIRTEERVRCILTGHEVPCKLPAIQQYLNGKKYKRMTKDLHETFKYSDYEPMIATNVKKGHEKHLFCTLTLRHINKTPLHVLRHVQGKKYIRAKKRWDECQKEGTKFVPTPYLNRQHEDANESTSDVTDEMLGGGVDDDSDKDSLSDLYPVKYLKDLSLDENENQPPVAEVKPAETSGRKRTKPPTKKSKFSKPSSKKKKASLVVFE